MINQISDDPDQLPRSYGYIKCIIELKISVKINVDRSYQGRQTRQNSGGVADLTKGGLQIFLNFYAIKI